MLKKELELLLSKCKEFISNELTKFRGDGDAETNVDLWLFEEHRMANLRGHAVIDQGFFRVFLRWLKWKFKQYFTKSEIINKRYKHIEWITPQHVNAEAGGTAKYAFKVFDEDGFEISETIINEDGDKISNDRYNITFQSFIDENELGDSYADVTSEITYENGHWVLSLTNNSEQVNVPFGGYIKISDNTKTDDEDTPDVNEMEEWLVDRVCGVVVEGMNIEIPELGFKDDGTSGLFVADIKADDTNPYLLTITRGSIKQEGNDDSDKTYVVSDVKQDGNNIKVVYSEIAKDSTISSVSVKCYKRSETTTDDEGNYVWEEFVPNWDVQYTIEYIETSSNVIKIYLKNIVIPDITLGLSEEGTSHNDGFINSLSIDSIDKHEIKIGRQGITVDNGDTFKDTLNTGEIQYVSKIEVPIGTNGKPLGKKIKVTYSTFTPTSGGTDFTITDGDPEDGKYVSGISATGEVTKEDLPTIPTLTVNGNASDGQVCTGLSVDGHSIIPTWRNAKVTPNDYMCMVFASGNTSTSTNTAFYIKNRGDKTDVSKRVELDCERSVKNNDWALVALPYRPNIIVHTTINEEATNAWYSGASGIMYVLPTPEMVMSYYGLSSIDELLNYNVRMTIVACKPASGSDSGFNKLVVGGEKAELSENSDFQNRPYLYTKDGTLNDNYITLNDMGRVYELILTDVDINGVNRAWAWICTNR